MASLRGRSPSELRRRGRLTCEISVGSTHAPTDRQATPVAESRKVRVNAPMRQSMRKWRLASTRIELADSGSSNWPQPGYRCARRRRAPTGSHLNLLELPTPPLFLVDRLVPVKPELRVELAIQLPRRPFVAIDREMSGSNLASGGGSIPMSGKAWFVEVWPGIKQGQPDAL